MNTLRELRFTSESGRSVNALGLETGLKSHRGETIANVMRMVDHTIVHFEIPADDVEKLRKFYAQIFGWKIEKMPGPMDYWNIETVPVDERGMLVRPGVNGGLMKRETPDQKLLMYIGVESVDEYSKRIQTQGGKIVISKLEIPGIGWWALALDPEGNAFGLFESKRA